MDLFCVVASSGLFSVIVELDGQTAYAYLLKGPDTIVGDVWLFNLGDAPVEPPWTEAPKAPFKNPAEYVASRPSPRIDSCADVTAVWRSHDDHVRVELVCAGEVIAVLASGEFPGQSAMAAKDGPIARTLAG